MLFVFLQAINTLKQLKQVQYIARANAWCDNVAATVLETKSDEDNVTEEKLVKALEGKYDALRDKLLLEVKIFCVQCFCQHGDEAFWGVCSF